MALKCIRKLVLVTLLLLSSAFYCYSQESSSEQHVTTEVSSLDLWNGIEWNLNLLENEQMFSQIRLQELEKKLEQSEKACQDKELVCLNLEASLEKSEQDIKRWKTFSIVLGSTTVTLTVTTVVLLMLVTK